MFCFKGYHDCFICISVYSFSTFAKFSEKLTFLIPWYAHEYNVRNFSFSENFLYVLDEVSLMLMRNLKFRNDAWMDISAILS